MIFKNNPLIPILSLLLLLAGACKNGPDDDDSTTVTENQADFYISSTDSGTQLQFSNYLLKNQDSFSVRINGLASDYKLLSDQVLVIQKNQMRAGNNMLAFIYRQDGAWDTISKSFFNTLKLEYEIISTFPHNSRYFTQGLLFDESGNLVESTGLKGESRIIFYRNLQDGFKPVDSIVNPKQEFGEGIAQVNGQLIQLLWQNMYLRIFDKASRKHIRNVEYSKEGWGICNDGNTIYTSDGSGSLYVIDISGNKAAITRSIEIRDENGLIANINELEFINGLVYANIWQSHQIYLIDPKTGSVVGKIDLSAIASKEEKRNPDIDVLNGIAFNPAKQTLLITGKYWANFYQIKLKNEIPSQSK